MAAMAAFERRLTAIYEALDSRQPKNALKLCNQALEKQDSILIQSLKSISLIRTARPEEARVIIHQLLSSQTSLLRDPSAIHTLVIAMRDLRMDKEVTLLYEAAHNKEPGDLDILDQLFFSYVKEGSPHAHVKQQLTAVKINKLDPCGKHAWWIVLSVMLQARDGIRGVSTGSSTAQLEPSKLMQLAESLAIRQADKDKRLDGFEALLVLIDILLAEGKDKEALDLVTSSRGDVASMSAERAHLNAVLLMRNGELKAAAAIFESQLKTQDLDDWITLGLYLDCIMGGGRKKEMSTHLWPDSSLIWLSGGLAEHVKQPLKETRETIDAESGHKAACATVDELILMVKENRVPSKQAEKQLTTRGPSLAVVEVARRAAALGLIDEIQVASAALDFLLDHGDSLVSCAVDLRGCCTSKLGPEASSWLIDRIMSNEQLVPSASPPPLTGSMVEDIKRCRTIVCSLQVVEDLGGPYFGTKEEAMAHAKRLMMIFAWAEPLYFGLDPRERGPADELPALAANSLIVAAVSHEESEVGRIQLLTHALLLLESCISLRPHSAQIRLTLAALHTLLGCPETARSHCQALDIKNIQLDSLASHHMLPALLSFYSPSAPVTQDSIPPPPSSLHLLLRDTLHLFSDHLKEAVSTLRDAYNDKSYSKVLEFIAFRERLEASHTRALARAERQILDIKDNFFADMKMRDSSSHIAIRGACLAMLPLSEIPSIDGPSRVRFNEDLSTRQFWYPSFSSGANLASCSWWGSMSEHLIQGNGRVWWSEPFISDDPTFLPSSPVHTYRAQKVSTLRQRWLLPHLLANAHAGNVSKLKDALGMIQPEGLRLRSMDSSGLVKGLVSQCTGVSLLIFGIFSALAKSLDKLPGFADAQQDLTAVGTLIDSLSALVISALATKQVSGCVLNLSSTLISECLLSLCICCRKFAEGQNTADDQGKAKASDEVFDSWKGLASRACTACASLSSALDGLSQSTILAEGSKIIKEFSLFSSGVVDSSFDATACLTRVKQEQGRVAGGLADAASRLSTELSSVFQTQV